MALVCVLLCHPRVTADRCSSHGVGEGAYADILLWSSDPTKDIMVLEDESKLGLIMKGGELYKNIPVSDTDPTHRPAPHLRVTPDDLEFTHRTGCGI